jgi:PepSY-associated TM region
VRLRWLVLFHRWAGVTLCLLFCTWFVSGAILHFVPFPSLTAAERLQRSQAINLDVLTLNPAAAVSLAPSPSVMRLISVVGRPVYVLHTSGERVSAIAADTGRPVGPISGSDAAAIAGAFVGATPSQVQGPIESDQWVVAQEYDPYRPFLRVHFKDPAGSVVYVCERSGEIVLRTTSHERRWNWVGAVLHWMYFAPLRSHWAIWDRLVWWLALVATCSTLAGVWLGVARSLANHRARRRGLTPFRGWLGWHHRIGLFAALIVVVWIVSGWLSMDHGRLFSRGEPTPAMASRVQGLSLDSIAAAAPREVLRSAGSAAEIEFAAIAGHPFIVARSNAAAASRIIWLDGSGRTPSSQIPAELLLAGVRRAWPGEVVTDRGAVTPSDLYGLAESMPAGTRVFRTERASAVDSYLDPVSGRLLVVMDASRRAYAWSYYALHTLKFPGLANHPTRRSIVIMALLALGFMFSLTGAVVGISRLRATLPFPDH